MCSPECPHSAERAHEQAKAAVYVALAKMAYGAGKRGEGHGRQRRAKGNMHGNVEPHAEHGDHDTCAASTHKAQQYSQQKHGGKNKHGSPALRGHLRRHKSGIMHRLLVAARTCAR